MIADLGFQLASVLPAIFKRSALFTTGSTDFQLYNVSCKIDDFGFLADHRIAGYTICPYTCLYCYVSVAAPLGPFYRNQSSRYMTHTRFQ